ncbi:hypothetical protein BZG35_16570 [Brevundimonas sp. LM2]|uniref:SDR family oxidoreductase n=1 Tax=Brevundimonas sp. LM2 TaxID=1938605 RepID=UPI000983D409|nr:SDR family NAD(P)-dependent oxidoreductase [Brevundimonas sp. LM2]AQR63087.1 hypothetical protein BZG35_16570 [Brevundimonas sp. LM2]
MTGKVARPGQVVVITGGTTGFGHALAEQFLRLGCKVVITGRVASDAIAVARALHPDHAVGVGADVRSEAGHLHTWQAAIDAFGRVDHWINNAGLGGAGEDIAATDPTLIRAMIDTNLTGVLLGTSVALNRMRAQGGGQIWVTEGLGSSGFVLEGAGIYGATKAGVTYLFRVLAKENAAGPVRIGFLRPGIMPTRVAFGSDAIPDARAARILALLGDDTRIVARWMAPRILDTRRNGHRLDWLTRTRLIGNLLRAGFRKLSGVFQPGR